MKAQRIVMISLTALTFLTSSLVSAMPAREVAEKFDHVLRKSHSTMIVKFKLSTCAYRISDSQMRCSEKPRSSVFENVLKYFGDDIRSTAIVLEPARDKGIGTLTHEYYDTDKDNATWIYLSALGKIKRIISTQDSEDSGSFFGSEFYVEDLDWRKLDDYTYKLLGEQKLAVSEKNNNVQRPAWILEWTPTPTKERKSKYGKIVSWIDKERYILLKEDYYDHNQQLFKKRTLKNVQLIDDNWMPRNITMNNLATRRVSVMDRQAIAFNAEVPDEFLTKRTLTDHVFRERHLSEFRSYLKN